MRRNKDFDLKETKVRLTKAFRYLRKQNGILAKQNFMCCGGCAGGTLATRITEENAKKPGRWNGSVYYHRQNNDSLIEDGEVYIHFGHASHCVDSSNVITGDDRPSDTVAIGQCAKEALERYGLEVEWNGGGGTCLLVKGVEFPKVKPVEIDGHTYTKPDHLRFIEDMYTAGLEVEHYRGRCFWNGPAVRVDELQEALSNTKVPCRYDSMGLGFIVYPNVSALQAS